MPKKIHLLIDNSTRLSFFKRVIINENVCPSVVYHSNLYTWLEAKARKFPGKHILLLQTNRSRVSSIPSIEEIKSGKEINHGISDHFVNISKAELWVFSGFQFAALELKQRYKSIRYFEIANFPGKYQSSNQGVNADADYDKRVRAIDPDSIISEDIIDELANNLINFRPPHVDVSILSKATEQLVNIIGRSILKTAAPHSPPIQQLKLAIEIKRVRGIIETFIRNPLPQSTFNLFIGQVSQDSQTLFQSKISTIEAIGMAHKSSQQSNIPLVVRLHPGEKNINAINEVVDFCGKNGIYISNNGNLLETTKKAEQIYTINSTGGLQSLLLRKPVTTYGYAFYKTWTAREAYLYYNHILLPLR